MTILLTGGCGYIGSHVAWALADAGREIVIVDDLSTGLRENAPPNARLIVGDIGNPHVLEDILASGQVTAVMHFAGRILPSESVERPLEYFHDNTANSITLLDVMLRHGVTKLIFSSTAAVYGRSTAPKVTEDAEVRPLSPYGHSKAMTETIVSSACHAHGLSALVLRYFNVAGADPTRRVGLGQRASRHLISNAIDVALGRRPVLQVFGNDFDTLDGTGVRDYIHVSDLASAHVSALDEIEHQTGFKILNCGYGRGTSVLEVINAVELITGAPLPVEIVARRPCDPPSMVADASRLMALGIWRPRHDAIEDIIEDALHSEIDRARSSFALSC